jgi:hypothetical protein
MPLPTHHARWQAVRVSGDSSPPGPSTGWQRVSADRTRTVTYLPPVWADTPVAMRFVLQPGDDPINSTGVRCEFCGSHLQSSGGGEVSGTSGVYAVAFWLPGGSSKNPADTKWALSPSWAILWQIHHPGSTGSPPFAVRADQGWGRYPNGKLFLDTRAGLGGSEINSIIHDVIPLDQWIRLIFEVKWGSNGRVVCHKKIGDSDWTIAFDKNIPTYYDGHGGGYWKGGGYFGDGRPASQWYHGGFARVQSVSEAKALFAPGAVPVPVPDTTGPQMTVIAPRPGTRITDGLLTWMVDAVDPSGISQVTVAVAGQVIARETKAPFGDGSPVSLPVLAPGGYDLVFEATDTVGNTTSAAVPVVIGPPPAQQVWVGTDADYQVALDSAISARNRAKAIASNYSNVNLKDAISSVANACQRTTEALWRFSKQMR